MHTLADPIANLWTAARAMFEHMRAAVGGACDIARRETLYADEICAMRAWLRPLEALVRKIVLLQAMTLQAAVMRTRLINVRKVGGGGRVCVTAAPITRRAYAFRLWPRQKPHPARIRQLGPRLLVRDIFRDRARASIARQLANARHMRRPEPERIARRIEALERVLAKPAIAARRLARKLRRAPRLFISIAVTRWPRSPHADRELQNRLDSQVFAACRGSDSS